MVSPALAAKLRKYGIQDSIHVPTDTQDLEDDVHFMAILKKIDEADEDDNLAGNNDTKPTCLPVVPTQDPDQSSTQQDMPSPMESLPLPRPDQPANFGQSPHPMPESETEKEYQRIAKNIENQAIKQIGGYKTDFTRPNIEAQEVLFERYKLPDYTKRG